MYSENIDLIKQASENINLLTRALEFYNSNGTNVSYKDEGMLVVIIRMLVDAQHMCNLIVHGEAIKRNKGHDKKPGGMSEQEIIREDLMGRVAALKIEDVNLLLSVLSNRGED